MIGITSPWQQLLILSDLTVCAAYIVYVWLLPAARFDQLLYSLIAFDERVIFWLQRARLPPRACVFAALYACVIA